MRAPSPAAASGNEHESARPRLLLYAQLLCKCFFFFSFFPSSPPPPSLPVCSMSASRAVSQLISPAPVLSRPPQIRPVLEARLPAGPAAPHLPGSACCCIPLAKGEALLLPSTCPVRRCGPRCGCSTLLPQPKDTAGTSPVGCQPKALVWVLAWGWKMTPQVQQTPGARCEAGMHKPPSHSDPPCRPC